MSGAARAITCPPSPSSSPRGTRRPGCHGRIENLLALDYPADLLEIIVVSDGSTDPHGAGAGAIHRRRPAAERRSRLRGCGSSRPRRTGKAAALNAGVAAARHDTIVFADARQRFAR